MPSSDAMISWRRECSLNGLISWKSRLVHVPWKREKKKNVETDTTAHSCRAKEEMRRLITKHPDGLAGFSGDLSPTKIGTTGVGTTAPSPDPEFETPW
jgi:hypothetical protein